MSDNNVKQEAKLSLG